MPNSKPRLSEFQIRRDERQKVYAEIAQRLSPPFTKTYLAKEIFGLSNKQKLTNYEARYIEKGSK